jgi:DNA repair protein RadC
VPVPVSGNPARSLEFAMSHDLFSSLDSFVAVSSAASSLLVRDVAGEYRPADADEVLQAAQRLLAGRVRGTDVLTSPAVVKDALSRNSSALLLVHNHPSGSPEPSRADELLTQTLKSAAALVDVRVLDHLIVAGDSVLSMAEKGLM